MVDVAILAARIGQTAAHGWYRVLVDRLWPRGVPKVNALWDEWLQEVAPTSDLRRWYRHEPARFDLFRERYRRELDARLEAPGTQRLLDLVRSRPVVLVTATADLAHSQAPILAQWLRQQLQER